MSLVVEVGLPPRVVRSHERCIIRGRGIWEQEAAVWLDLTGRTLAAQQGGGNGASDTCEKGKKNARDNRPQRDADRKSVWSSEIFDIRTLFGIGRPGLQRM